MPCRHPANSFPRAARRRKPASPMCCWRAWRRMAGFICRRPGRSSSPPRSRASRASAIRMSRSKSFARFAGDSFTAAELREDIEAAYAGFDAPEIAPLSAMSGNRYLLELFHGPTFAFKDIALQILGRLFARALAQARRPRHHCGGDFGRYRLGGDRRAGRACPISRSSCCIPRAASAKCSAAR